MLIPILFEVGARWLEVVDTKSFFPKAFFGVIRGRTVNPRRRMGGVIPSAQLASIQRDLMYESSRVLPGEFRNRGISHPVGFEAVVFFRGW